MLAQQSAGRRAHGGHVQRLEAPAGAPGPQRGTHAAAPQQIDVGARTGRETGMEIVRNLPGPLHGDRRRQEGVHAAHPGLHAPVQRRVQVHDLHGAVHAGVGAARANGGHRALHAAEAGQRGLQRVLHGLAVRLCSPTLPGRAVVGQPQCDSGHRSGLGSARAARFIRRRLVQVEADGLELAVQRGRVQRRLGVSVGFLVVIATARGAAQRPGDDEDEQRQHGGDDHQQIVGQPGRRAGQQIGRLLVRSALAFWCRSAGSGGLGRTRSGADGSRRTATPAAPAAELEPAAPAAPSFLPTRRRPLLRSIRRRLPRRSRQSIRRRQHHRRGGGSRGTGRACRTARSSRPSGPVEPAAPAEPEAPAAPAAPADPATPPAPVAPACPAAPCSPTALFNASTLPCNVVTRACASAIACPADALASPWASACAWPPSCPLDRRRRSWADAAEAAPVSPERLTVPDAALCPLTTVGFAPPPRPGASGTWRRLRHAR